MRYTPDQNQVANYRLPLEAIEYVKQRARLNGNSLSREVFECLKKIKKDDEQNEVVDKNQEDIK